MKVIGIEGKPGTGKSTLAKNLTKKLNRSIHIEESEVFLDMAIIFENLKDNKTYEEIIDYIYNIKIDYKIENNKLKFILSGIPSSNLSPLEKKLILYNHLEYKEPVCKMLYKLLNDIIDKEKENYTIIFTGRELSNIYPSFDNHFTLCLSDEERFKRMNNRDRESNLIKKREEKDDEVFETSKNTINIDINNLDEEEVLNKVIKYL